MKKDPEEEYREAFNKLMTIVYSLSNPDLVEKFASILKNLDNLHKELFEIQSNQIVETRVQLDTEKQIGAERAEAYEVQLRRRLKLLEEQRARRVKQEERNDLLKNALRTILGLREEMTKVYYSGGVEDSLE